MHDYSMRGHPRERLIYYLAAASFSLVPLVTSLSGWIGVTQAISTFAVFTLMFLAFDKFLWRLTWLRRLFGMPNLNGSWMCRGQRLDASGQVVQEWTAKVRIKQTWSRIAVCLQTETSTSRSGPASIAKDEGLGFRLLYSYRNDPHPGSPTMSPHDGTCDLVFDEECRTAKGIYFNDFNRQTFGRMELNKDEN